MVDRLSTNEKGRVHSGSQELTAQSANALGRAWNWMKNLDKVLIKTSAVALGILSGITYAAGIILCLSIVGVIAGFPLAFGGAAGLRGSFILYANASNSNS